MVGACFFQSADPVMQHFDVPSSQPSKHLSYRNQAAMPCITSIPPREIPKTKQKPTPHYSPSAHSPTYTHSGASATTAAGRWSRSAWPRRIATCARDMVHTPAGSFSACAAVLSARSMGVLRTPSLIDGGVLHYTPLAQPVSVRHRNRADTNAAVIRDLQAGGS